MLQRSHILRFASLKSDYVIQIIFPEPFNQPSDKQMNKLKYFTTQADNGKIWSKFEKKNKMKTILIWWWNARYISKEMLDLC